MTFTIDWNGREWDARIAEAEGAQSSTRIFAAILTLGDTYLPLGAITIDRDRQTIELVGIDSGARRQGLATKLLETAREATGWSLDASGNGRSAMGEAFMDTAGIGYEATDVIENERTAEGWWARLATDLSFGDIEFNWLDG